MGDYAAEAHNSKTTLMTRIETPLVTFLAKVSTKRKQKAQSLV